MTVHDDILAANSAFFDVDGFAETLELFKGGLPEYPSVAVSFAGVWDANSESGDNSEPGDGNNLETEMGRRIRHTIFIEVPLTLDVDERRHPPDAFRRGIETVYLKRIHSRDEAAMTLECVRVARVRSRMPKRTG